MLGSWEEEKGTYAEKGKRNASGPFRQRVRQACLAAIKAEELLRTGDREFCRGQVAGRSEELALGRREEEGTDRRAVICEAWETPEAGSRGI